MISKINQYTLQDCQKKNEQFPETFHIPSSESCDDLKRGKLVKLIFEYEDGHAERMWVCIAERDGDKYIGHLDNSPVLIDKEHLKYNDLVIFETRHIAAIWEV